mmetsp:Transcript_34093/g.73670  ORF Transcript_34093/g.73670 Transcript_34093/m.73670 type:complete len:209 (-) Transcript_34093:603-1229(-)
MSLCVRGRKEGFEEGMRSRGTGGVLKPVLDLGTTSPSSSETSLSPLSAFAETTIEATLSSGILGAASGGECGVAFNPAPQHPIPAPISTTSGPGACSSGSSTDNFSDPSCLSSGLESGVPTASGDFATASGDSALSAGLGFGSFGGGSLFGGAGSSMLRAGAFVLCTGAFVLCTGGFVLCAELAGGWGRLSAPVPAPAPAEYVFSTEL